MLLTIKPELVEIPDEPLAPIGDEGAIFPFIEPIPADVAWLSPVLDRLPNHIKLGALRDGRLRVLSPISVDISTEGQQVIAEALELNEFGFGENHSEAIRDLQRAIAELYFALEKDKDNLGIDLRQTLDVMHQKIREL